VLKRIPSWLVVGLVSVTIATSPNLTYEPFDNIKLLLLGITAAFALAESLAYRNTSEHKSVTWLAIPLFFFIVLFIPVLFSNAPFTQQIYGAAGRSIGFLHYAFLLSIFIGVIFSKETFCSITFIKTIIATGLFEGIYGLIQHLNLDPISWDNSGNWIFGTFGNPNFLSAFLGLSLSASLFVNVLKLSRNWILAGYLNLVVSVFVIYVSESMQGLFLFGLGFYFFIQYFAFRHSKITGIFLSFTSLAASFFVISGLLDQGILARYLHQDSTTFRGDYWRAGFRMFKDNFLTGVGLDSYGDNYRLYRDSIAANRRGLDLFSTSAHNIYLDLAATGGIFLLLAFVVFNLFVFSFGFIKLKNSDFKNVDLIVLMVLWIGFQAQLIISINVSSVAIWGFVASGLIVREGLLSETKNVAVNRNGKLQISATRRRTGIYRLILLPVFMALVFPLLLRDVQLASAISNSSKEQLVGATTSWPQSCFYLAKTEEALSEIKDFPSSLAVSDKSVSLNPKCFDSWRHIYENPTSSKAQIAEARKRMMKLDPNLVIK